jgi:phosphodiesterase/alkaline phosphatase D-like protein
MFTNKNILAIVVAVLVLGGLAYIVVTMNKTSNPITQTPMQNNPSTPNNPTTPDTSNPSRQPGSPIVVTSPITTISNSTANVTGTINPNGAGTAYWVEYGTTTGLGVKTTPGSMGAVYATLSTPVYITGLRANTVYYYRLVAENAYGAVSGTVQNFTTNSNPPVPVVLPVATTYSTTDVQRNSAIVKGQVKTNGAATNYWFEYGTSNNLGGISTIQTLEANVDVRDVNMQLINLAAQTKYYYRINAQNQFGTVSGSVMTFTTTGPADNQGAPQATTDNATNIAKSSATFNGRIDPNGVATTYWFEYGITSALLSVTGTSSQTLSAGTTAKSVSLPVTKLNPSTKYYYRVIAQNQYGTDYGNIGSFTTRQ